MGRRSSTSSRPSSHEGCHDPSPRRPSEAAARASAAPCRCSRRPGARPRGPRRPGRPSPRAGTDWFTKVARVGPSWSAVMSARMGARRGRWRRWPVPSGEGPIVADREGREGSEDRRSPDA
jgi:hypothetical protein